ncbi:hypothetical protein [Rappaport israeli]|uniref:hypothetical protein n=1 Tax=Rappaport israeli TaxID=1839807 RepID=UPI0009320210|nr:hypothetical protein [Rappaport israeli]
MHLDWSESKVILNHVLKTQMHGKGQKQAVASSVMWRHFCKQEQQLKPFKQAFLQYKSERKAIFARYRYQRDTKYTCAQNSVLWRLNKEKREQALKQLENNWQQQRKMLNLKPHERYLHYLYQQAQKNNEQALTELNRVYPKWQTHHRQEEETIVFEIRSQTKYPQLFSTFDFGLNTTIKRNGTIEYRDQSKHNKVVIVDSYQSIKVKEKSEDVFSKALVLAQRRYGTDKFEIIGASKEDLAAIQKAVNQQQVNVKVLQVKNLPPKTSSKDKDHQR